MTKRQHERGEPAPGTLPWIQLQFPDEAACVRYLTAKRWPDGFRCPCCSARKAWELKIRPGMFECASCGRQTSVTAGTVMHGSKVPLQLWFWAAHLMATHSNGISAMQLYRQLGLGSYKTAWLLCSKLRRAMAFRDRTELVGLVEVDEAVLPWVHRVFALLKRWSLGTYHGVRRKHIQRYLEEFVYRFNRRRYRGLAFDRLLGLTMNLPPAGYRALVSHTDAMPLPLFC